MLIETRESITVRHIVQWSTCHDLLGRLRSSDGYPRRTHDTSAGTIGRYLLKIIHQTDDDLLVFNMRQEYATIVDGAARIATLVKFQQGQIGMVVKHGDLPDGIKCREHGESMHNSEYDRSTADNETLVEAFYSDMPPEMQQKFLTSKLTVLKVEDIPDVEEAAMHFNLNGCRPSSPVYPSTYDEAQEVQKVYARLFSSDAEHLRAILGSISGFLAPVIRCEVLRLLTKVLDDADEQRQNSNTVLATPSVNEASMDVGANPVCACKRHRSDSSTGSVD